MSSFYKRKLKQTVFKNCSLQEVDFTEADLTLAVFNHCDLQSAIFDQSNLEQTNLSSAFNFSINPDQNRIKKTRFSQDGIIGLTRHLDIIIDNQPD
jgi:uncharacterized protein YjbI with pentapeptide repeats